MSAAQAWSSLQGLALGDAFGERFFAPTRAWVAFLEGGDPPDGVWRWTDDTAQAVALVQHLRATGGDVDPAALGRALGERYLLEPARGYGRKAHGILADLGRGVPWEQAAAVYGGTGSMGNGSAMRVAPLGAWHAGEPERAAALGARSALPTHLHPEGQAAAAAVAVAASVAAGGGTPADVLDAAIGHTPASQTRDRLETARDLPLDTLVFRAAAVLGNGYDVLAQHTAPLAVWLAARHLDAYADAVRSAILGGGDIDTVAAMVGGVVGGRVGLDGLPASWLRVREPVPLDAP